MKICPACKQRNGNDADFCQFCGFSIANLAQDPQASVLQAIPPPSSQLLAVHIPAGTMIDGKYEIIRILGEGGMGVVYLARDIHTETDVVIKAIRAEYSHRKDFRDRILAEGRTLARIDHPNVVRLNAVVVEPAALYLVMQFIEGESLDRTIERHVQMRTPIPLDLTLRVFFQVLDGVGAAHREGVIHRDLKPGNILLRTRDAVAKVTDFGIAKAEQDAQTGKGQTKGIIGSLLYMAPEQLRGQRDLDKRADIYALGILFFELLSGHVPFDAPSEFEVMKMHLEAPVPRLSILRTDLPQALDEVLARACAKDRNQRFTCCEEFSAALHNCFGLSQSLPIAASPRLSQFVSTPQQYLTDVGQLQASHAQRATNVQNLQPAPAHAITNQGLSSEPIEERNHSPLTFAAFGLGLVVVLTAGGLALAWGLGFLNTEPTSSTTVSKTTGTSLSKLTGAWKSDSGLLFDAIMSGDTLEFRIHDTNQFPNQGYVAQEARFSLSALPSNPNTFLVADNIHPVPPANTHYDLQRSRMSCQELWSEVNGEALHAQFDGTRLTVELAKIEPEQKSFTLQGNAIVGCVNLRNAPASRIEVLLTH
jgi:serine/threonine-protein kinase